MAKKDEAKKNEYKYDELLAPAERGNKVDEEAAARAEDAGVKSAEYVDYEAALQNYESRPDVETLEQRRARENGTSFGDAAFRREAGQDQPGVVTSDETDNK